MAAQKRDAKANLTPKAQRMVDMMRDTSTDGISPLYWAASDATDFLGLGYIDGIRETLDGMIRHRVSEAETLTDDELDSVVAELKDDADNDFLRSVSGALEARTNRESRLPVRTARAVIRSFIVDTPDVNVSDKALARKLRDFLDTDTLTDVLIPAYARSQPVNNATVLPRTPEFVEWVKLFVYPDIEARMEGAHPTFRTPEGEQESFDGPEPILALYLLRNRDVDWTKTLPEFTEWLVGEVRRFSKEA